MTVEKKDDGGAEGRECGEMVLGNHYNYWKRMADGVWDLTRSLAFPTTTPKTIQALGTRKSIIIEPSRSALVMIDMQNYFLHPSVRPRNDIGRSIVPATVDTVNAFRASGMKVLWTNWGITNAEILTLPPSSLDLFSRGTSDPNHSFGCQLGAADGIDMGNLLMRGSWNAQLYGPLLDLYTTGAKAGTDFLFDKNRLSGLWGPQTPLGIFLEENGITTLFIGGVNTDQCVWSTFIDAYFKGYDAILVDDLSATSSPESATEMVRYNANLHGFLVNSTDVLQALQIGN